ncbi:MAG TPA: PAS domain-containing sensor histidine kinase [Ignavibacteriaceae bacterium]|nr:PAS domain-containing sensor histidine kinase [Ignavibacteriaceae bacterium]
MVVTKKNNSVKENKLILPDNFQESKFTVEKLWESEESLRVLMNSNPEAVFILDIEGNFIAANEKTAQRFGKPIDELIGTNVYSYLTPELAKNRKEKVDEVIKTSKPVRFDDSRNNRYYDNYLHPVFDSDGKVIRIAVWVIEFTERKLAVDALKSSEEKFRELAENIQDIFWIRKDNEVLYVSPAYEIICGKTCESLYQDPNSFLLATHPDDLPNVLASLNSQKYKENGLFDEEFRIVRPDGSIKWIWAKTFPVIKDGQIIRTVGIAEDISLRKEYEEKIQEALTIEKELNDLKSRFISMVSHEFRTPLGLILSSTELLQNYGYKWDENKRNEQFERIKKSVDNLTGLMKDVILLSEAGQIKIAPNEIDIINFLDELIDEIKGSLKEYPEIIFNHKTDSLKVISDKKLLRQIFMNLISNAVKFTSIKRKVFVELTSTANNFTTIIKDEGIGIPDEDLENIFEPFIRAKNIGEVKGSGLGLSIVKNAVNLLKGEIKVKSKLNEGSVFTVKLPTETRVSN